MSGPSWRPIPDYQYEVSDTGRVRNVRTGRLLKNSRDSNGYACVNLFSAGKAQKFYVHRLVAAAFIPPVPDKPQVAHFDGDGMNPAVSNLRWASQAENEKDKVRHGRANRAPRGSRTFSEYAVQDLLRRADAGESLRAIARRYKSNHGTVARALRNGPAQQLHRIQNVSTH